MKYFCKLVDDQPRERPIQMYTDSWAEAQRWAKLILERDQAARVDIFENIPTLRKSYVYESKEK